jgi:hypothetical protein
MVLGGHNGVEYLAELQDGIDCYGCIVDWDFPVCECLLQELVVCVWYTELLVVVYVPETRVQAMEGGSEDKNISISVSLVYTIHT